MNAKRTDFVATVVITVLPPSWEFFFLLAYILTAGLLT